MSTTGFILLLVFTALIVIGTVVMAIRMKSYQTAIAMAVSYLVILAVVILLYATGIITL